MTIQRLKAPTLEEVQRTINAMEKEFRVSSSDFQKPEVYTSIPEDAAADWYFALQQHAVLAQMYWKIRFGPPSQGEMRRQVVSGKRSRLGSVNRAICNVQTKLARIQGLITLPKE